MQLPFTTEQFFDALRACNVAVWPAQVILIGLEIAAIVLLFVPRTWCGTVISVVLASLWAWVGLAYHLTYFAPINRVAYVFAAASLVGAALFVWHGVVRRRLVFKWSWMETLGTTQVGIPTHETVALGVPRLNIRKSG